MTAGLSGDPRVCLRTDRLAHSVTDSQTDMFIAIRRFHGHDNGECWTAWRYADVLSDRQTDRQTDRETERQTDTLSLQQLARSAVGMGIPMGMGMGWVWR